MSKDGRAEGWRVELCGRRIMKSLCSHCIQMELIKPRVCRTVGQEITLGGSSNVNICHREKRLSCLGEEKGRKVNLASSTWFNIAIP